MAKKHLISKDKDLSSHGTLTEAILESISDGVFTVDNQWRITFFNRAAEEITGTSRKEAIGKQCFEVFRCSMCETECALRESFKTGKSVANRTGFIIDADGRRVPISVSTAVMKTESGEIVGGGRNFQGFERS